MKLAVGVSRIDHLQHAVNNWNDHKHELNDEGLHLMRRGIFAIYTDCIAIGEGSEAVRILRKVNRGIS